MLARATIASILLVTLAGPRGDATARQVAISEIMPRNTSTLFDEDGDASDWIELRNPVTAPVQLGGYLLSDGGDPSAGWAFPETSIEASGYLTVFASGKDRSGPVGDWSTVIARGHGWRYRAGGADLPPEWIDAGFDDAGWATGPSGFGYGDSDDGTVVQGAVSVALRAGFDVADLAGVVGLALHVDFDDGFVAYLNGREVARSNMGPTGVRPSWDQYASPDHEAEMYQGGDPSAFDLSAVAGLLVPGRNVLAVEVHNVSPGSSDLSIIPFLSIATASVSPSVAGADPEIRHLFARPLHADFRLAAGETVCLADSTGSVLDCMEVPETPPDVSVGRDGSGAPVFFATPTPGAPNAGATYLGTAPAPLFSHAAGHYAAPFTLTMGSDAPGARIVVTSDGSTPGTNSSVGSVTLSVSATRVVRARVVLPGYLPGPVETKTFVFEPRRDMPVVSLSTDPANLWDWNTGIYVEGPNAQPGNPHFGANYWQDWEKPVHVEWFEPGGEPGMSVDAGMQIYGGWSRAHPQKSVALFARASYGSSAFDLPLFTNRPHESYESFVLRNSGNDWNRSMLRDGAMQSLVEDTEIDWMAYRPAVSYLNGEYWGILNVREKINEHYVAQNGGVDPDAIDLMEYRAGAEVVPIRGDGVAWEAMMSLIRSADIGSAATLVEIGRHMDLDNFIDYQIAQIFFDNTDWPGNNTKVWRARDQDGRFRWILYDTDFGFGLYNPSNYNNNTLAFATATDCRCDWPNPPWSTYLLRRLLANATFRRAFVNRYADFLNTRFSTQSMLSVLDSLAAAIAPEMPLHGQRWGLAVWRWEQDMEVMRQFARSRGTALTQYVRQAFALAGTAPVTVRNRDPGRGAVRVNRETIRAPDWTGSYFIGVPLQVAAVPAPGYRFAGWSGSASGEERILTIRPEDRPDLTAAFEPAPGAESDIVINEIQYHPADDSGEWIELRNTSLEDRDISGWSVGDGRGGRAHVLEPGSVVPAGGFFVVAQDADRFGVWYAGSAPWSGGWDFSLSNGGDSVLLFDVAGALADSVTYDDGDPWPPAADGLGFTLELTDAAVDNALPGFWSASTVMGGSPGARNGTATRADAAAPDRPRADLAAYPNPFAGSARLRLAVPGPGRVEIGAYDVLGRELARIDLGRRPAGRAEASLALRATGVVILRMLLDDVPVASCAAIALR